MLDVMEISDFANNIGVEQCDVLSSLLFHFSKIAISNGIYTDQDGDNQFFFAFDEAYIIILDFLCG